MTPTSAEPERARSGWPPPQGRPEIWAVDDSRLQGDLCRAALSDGFDVTVHDSGAGMLEVLALSDPPDLLVLDWHMPDMSGAEVCRFVRERLNSAELPILILTASGADESLLDGLAAGANDFVRKPFSAPELNARVKALLRAAADHRKLALVEQQLRVEADFRERFMGMLAHDLRQPLNAIFMAASALSKQLGDTPHATTAAIQLRAADRMRRMIAELLDFTRIRPETGMPIQRQSADFEATARATLEEVKAAYPTRTFRFAAAGNCQGQWDQDRLAQVCSNLIGNAIEHSAADSAVDVQLSCDDGDNVKLVIGNVGKPLNEDVLGQLFLPFRRGAGKPSTGVGLGLYIVHQIVTGHGGSVTAKSEDGRTEFVVRLPRVPQTH